MSRPTAAMALIVVAALLQACAAPTYINIPSQRGDTAFHSPNGPSVVAVQTQALGSVISAGEPGPFEFVLPKGTTVEVYNEVAQQLGPDAIIPAGDIVEGQFPIFESRAVRIRGGSAEVDVIRPDVLGNYQLVEVRVQWTPLGGWNVTDQRPRRITVQPPRRPQLDLLPDNAGLALPSTQPEADTDTNADAQERSEEASVNTPPPPPASDPAGEEPLLPVDPPPATQPGITIDG